ncbi:MAG: hypothetical protein MJ230_01635 [bacterium]|nr:hypothetical protein [bacterium]
MEDELKLKIIQMRTERNKRYRQLLDKFADDDLTDEEDQERERIGIELLLLEALMPYGS